MKKLIILSLGVFLLTGCVAVKNSSENAALGAKYRLPTSHKNSISNINLIYEGMTYQEVVGLMGKSVVVGYQNIDFSGKNYDPVTLPAPYREDVFSGGGKTYKVLYYFNDVQNADSIVSEDELIPVVFEKNKMIGKGVSFLSSIKSGIK